MTSLLVAVAGDKAAAVPIGIAYSKARNEWKDIDPAAKKSIKTTNI